jgi:hypothetical protein
VSHRELTLRWIRSGDRVDGTTRTGPTDRWHATADSGGMGLEAFHRHLGWREVGRWPRALYLAADDARDEVLFDRERRPGPA